MMHGFLGSGDTYANHFARFTANNYCSDRLFTHDWNSLDQAADHVATLNDFVDEVLSQTGAEQVTLMGHSAGGGLGYDYLSDFTRATKVKNYVHIGSFPSEQPAGPTGEVPTLNLWSLADAVVESADIPGAVNVSLANADHYEVATNAGGFEAIYKFLNDNAPPQTTDIVAQTDIDLSGKALTFGENIPLEGGTINIYETDAATGFRKNTEPDATFTVDAKGFWGPFRATANATYEFEVIPASSDERTIHYYREGFTRSNPLVYLRSVPPPGSLAGTLLATLPQDDNQTLIAVFSSSQAVINGRDELHLNEYELSSETLTPEDETAIAFFVYDDGNDEISSGNSIFLFDAFPFLVGLDVFIPTSPQASVAIAFNGRTLNVPNLRSQTDGPVVVVFD